MTRLDTLLHMITTVYEDGMWVYDSEGIVLHMLNPETDEITYLEIYDGKGYINGEEV